MDILISSNLERLIYRIAGEDADKTREMMNELSKDGKYEITAEMRAQLKDFYGNYATEEETAKIIKNCMKIRDMSLIRIQQLQPAFMKNIKQLQR